MLYDRFATLTSEKLKYLAAAISSSLTADDHANSCATDNARTH